MTLPAHALRRSVRQPRTLDPAQLRRLYDALDDGVSYQDLCRRFDLCDTTLRKIVRTRNELRGEG